MDHLFDVAVTQSQLKLVELVDCRIILDPFEQQPLELGHLQRNCQLMQEDWYRQVTFGVEYSLAAILEVRVNLLLGKVQGISPSQQPTLLGIQLPTITVMMLLKLAKA